MDARKCPDPRCNGTVDLTKQNVVVVQVFESNVVTPLRPCNICRVLCWGDGNAFVRAIGHDHAYYRNGQVVWESVAA